jgi:amino acid adenylation domain-containing protein
MRVDPSDSAGAATGIPRWTAPRVGRPAPIDCEVRLDAGTIERLRAVASACRVPLSTVVLAAHLAVLRTVTAEPELLVAAVGRPVRVDTATKSWRDLVMRADRATRRRPEPGASPRTAFLVDGEAADTGYELTAHLHTGAVPSLVLRSRTDVTSAEQLARLSGYHGTALHLLGQDPDAPVAGAVLLSADEIRHQVHGLAGPSRPLGAETVLDRWRERVEAEPDRAALSHRGRSWTAGTLDSRANRYAWALIEHGVRAEDSVAVVLERGLDWVAAMLGVLKAGAVYLPVPPGLPAARAAAQLTAAGCRVALGDPDAPALASAEVSVLSPVTSRDDDPRVAVRADQAAYLYFTSGSTGAPKGVLCEHAGLLNHLLMKIEDFELCGGDVVAQTAASWLDISLWQTVAVLLAGGRMDVIDTELLLEIDEFLDALADAGTTVVQLVPSYFEVLTHRLTAAPRDLGSLRLVSVTGEALRHDVVRRWFAASPVRLVNAYGATELSDDTMHEILDAVPERPFVSLGRPGRNVYAYVLDGEQRLVPLGTPGEIAFSGVCVGRGYAGDEEATARAFRPDPYRPGERLYLTGDYGRWLPEGRMEFLGRRDQQVKIDGIRVEIGEVESGLLDLPGVQAAAVVVDQQRNRRPALVAFLAGDRLPDGVSLAARMAAALPEHLTPTYFHQLDALPLNENGKVDRRGLSELARTLGHAGSAHVAPRTPTEQRLAQAWAEVLDVPLERIGRRDQFFDLGGSSLAAMWLVAKLDGLIPLRQVVRRPVLAELADLVDGAAGGGGGLLQPLAVPAGEPVATLVCLPYAAGSAVNFRALADHLAPAGVAVHAAELPGHDLSAGDQALAGVVDVAEALAGEIVRLGDAPLLLWGHGTGAAYALALARRLEEGARPPRRVFLGAALLDPPDRLRAQAAGVAARSDRDIVAELLADGAYVEFGALRRERETLIGRAFRHDVRATREFLLAAARAPDVHRIRAVVEVVVAGDDPRTPEHRRRYGDWIAFSDRVVLRELSEGGHYFTRMRPAETAGAVLAACGQGDDAEGDGDAH